MPAALFVDDDKKKSRPIIIVPITDLHIPLSHLSDPTKGLDRQDQGEVTNIILAPRTAALSHTSTAKNIEGSTSVCDALDAIEKTPIRLRRGVE